MRDLRTLAGVIAFAAASALAPAAGAQALSGTADQIATKLVEKFRMESCEQLDKERKARKSVLRASAEKRAAERLRADPQLRAAFLAKVAIPVADKMIVCGFIP